MEDTENTIRILVATDCHLGYLENDQVRGNDTFDAFEEICSIAEQKQVDFLLLGGDLFDENRPSMSTLVKTTKILRRYCLKDRPVSFQVVNERSLHFQNTLGHLNYEDPYFKVGLIARLLHSWKPRQSDRHDLEDSGVGHITLHPVLIKKGSTAVALYGLGNIRDERLNRLFQTPHAIQWMRPESQEECQVSNWFNIFVLHQNRAKANEKNAINEHFLPRFLDFIVWGHEHECLVDPQEVPGMGFHISQPGSSVATALSAGESKPKHVLLLEIKGNQYHPTKIPLMSVRPFEYVEIILKDEPDIDWNDQNSIFEYLDNVVGKMLEKCNKKAVSTAELKLPLIRIKVTYSGFTIVKPHRFGQKYVGKVANPEQILKFSKGSKRAKGQGKIDDSKRPGQEELNQQIIEALIVKDNLEMGILPVNDLNIALPNFVDKDDEMAFHSCVQKNINEIRDKIAYDLDLSLTKKV